MRREGLTPIELIFTVITICLAALVVYALVKYANTPVSEMPVWVYWLIGR